MRAGIILDADAIPLLLVPLPFPIYLSLYEGGGKIGRNDRKRTDHGSDRQIYRSPENQTGQRWCTKQRIGISDQSHCGQAFFSGCFGGGYYPVKR